MSRNVQQRGKRGSLRWIQSAILDGWESLEQPILAELATATRVDWRSPIAADDFAEYRDGDFLDLVGLTHLRSALSDFWPDRGPQWDALGVSDRQHVLLVEAKAHVAEMCSPGTTAGPSSALRISHALDECAKVLGAREARAAWTEHFYQLANRIAHLHFLRERGVPAYLVLVNFLNDQEMNGPTTQEAWEAAYQVAFHVMGLPKRHALSRYILHVFPDVSGR
jgi:hypothetical protein